MMRSLYSGVSGLKTHQTKMDVIGNNISNVNTVAFKSSSTQFQDIMYQTTQGASGATATVGGKNPKQIGLGVTSGATKISITSSGAAQSTGEAFDIRLVDSNSTNFFVVSNGTSNLFTRAGSFYLDGNGNLAMTATGYLVMGWQVNPETNEIAKDVVTPLRLMKPENMTSNPELTSQGTFSGIIDENDVNVTSDSGYYRNFTFYDNLGYAYTAKFSLKMPPGDEYKDNNRYTVELVSILDSTGQDILNGTKPSNLVEGKEGYLYDANGDAIADHSLSDIFGLDTTVVKTYKPDKSFTVGASGELSKTVGNVTYTISSDTTQGPVTNGGTAMGYFFQDAANNQVFYTLAEIYGVNEAAMNNPSFEYQGGNLVVTGPATNYNLKFKTSDGSFEYINDLTSEGKVTLNMSRFGDMFEDITLDFTQMKTLDNGGSSTVEAESGGLDGTTGKGKKIGEMTSIAVSGDGRIFGSYSNGNTILLGQIAVARFANASGLESLGNNCYGTTLNSGDFDGIGVDVTADGGSMNSGQLEMSNVDLSTEFTEMITTQRGFQANSRIITVSDTLLEELTNLKR